MTDIKLIFVVGGLYTESSGIARILCDIANALEKQGLPVPVYTACRSGASTAKHMLDNPSRCCSHPAWWLGRLSHSPELKKALDSTIKDIDLVHNHSLWMLPNAYSSTFARKYNKPVIFTSYGYLEPWAFQHSKWKKDLAGKWFQKKDLQDSACIHVATENEIQGVRNYGLKNPVAVIPNGVDLQKYNTPPLPSLFNDQFNFDGSRKRVLFLSRLHKKKGVLNLLEAWSNLDLPEDDWELVLCGPDDGYENEFKNYAESKGLGKQVHFTGPVSGEAKLAAYASADAFILPSYSEGFSNAILEAMASSLPVIITPECNFPEALTKGAGIKTSQDSNSIKQALNSIMEMNDDERKAMGQNGRRLIETKYCWEKIAPEMIKLYSWISGKGEKPGFVTNQ